MREVNIAIGLAGLLLFATNAARGQASEKLEFEVASVKPMPPSSPQFPETGGPGTTDPGQITWSGVPLKWLLKTAYDVRLYQISGPAWLDSERYMIVAKVPEGATKEQVNLMWQKLLKDRFGLVVHHESRVFKEAEEMTLAKGAFKLKETDLPDSAPQVMPGMGLKTGPDGLPQLPAPGLIVMGDGGTRRILARAQSLAQVASFVAQVADHPVIDKTGLTGRYDFNVDLDLNQPPAPGDSANQPSPIGNGTYVPCWSCAIASALEQGLGLKLVKSTVQLDMIVVDHAGKIPTDN
jgi:uncharacterized protein (TIGR03435 family)